MKIGPFGFPSAGDIGNPYHGGSRAYVEGVMFLIPISCWFKKKRVFWEGVVRDAGNSLESPFFRTKDFGGGVGYLRDVSHSRDNALRVQVGANGWSKGRVGYEIGAFYDFLRGFLMRRPSLWGLS